MSLTPAAETLSGLIAPAVVARLDADRAALIEASGPAVVRMAARMAWPRILAVARVAVADGVDATLTRMGAMTVSQVCELVADHMSQAGLQAHPSVEMAAGCEDRDIE